MKFLPLAVGILAAPLLQAEVQLIDFENMSADLPGWRASADTAETKTGSRPAASFVTPMMFSLDDQGAHSGSNSLMWKFVEPATRAGLRTPDFAASGSKVKVTFVVRSEGMTKMGYLIAEQKDAEGKRCKFHWNAKQIPLSTEWETVEWETQLEPITGSLSLSFMMLDPFTDSTLWIDDISVEFLE
jgi:hypothetical protein